MTHPYSDLPNRQFWRRAVTDRPWTAIDFFSTPKFTLPRTARIATAGSCFAANISRHLRLRGGRIYCVEQAHPLLTPELAAQMNYGHFSARYGNIYTVRQMLELVKQAAGHIPAVLDIVEKDGGVFDLLRPAIQSEGFSCRAEAQADRAFHLRCVDKLLRTADVFIFTLGLTEAWQHVSGHTYPMCPGTAAGSYDPTLHKFVNFTCSQVSSDLRNLIGHMHDINPALKIILTVSPVHLVATHENTNVLLASTYSKSVLRSACGEVAREFDFLDYFPAYEIVLSAASFGQYLESDLRDISERGITHVMDTFFNAYLSGTAPFPEYNVAHVNTGTGDRADLAARMLQAECDELLNDPSMPAANHGGAWRHPNK